MQSPLRYIFIIAVIAILFIRCSSKNVDVPGPLQGVWVEDSVKNDGPDDSKTWEKSSGFGLLLKFEKQGKKANVFKGNIFDPVTSKYSWSDSFALKGAGKNSWTFRYGTRKVSVKMNPYGHLIVKGLSMRTYNPALYKDRDPEPVEQIFVKKE